MKDELKIITAIGVLIIVFVNLTRITWKKTETGYLEAQEIACLQGGGNAIHAESGRYIGCEKVGKEARETKE